MTSQKTTKSRDANNKEPQLIPQEPANKFLQHIELRAWTDAEKELDTIRQKSDGSPWSRGYVKALEGLILTYKNNDDKYVFLPKILANRTEETIENLKKEFSEFASNELHGEYDRGYFRALEDYVVTLAHTKEQKVTKESPPSVPIQQQATLDQPATSTDQG